MKKIKIEPSEAGEWMAEGYTIECYAIVQPVVTNTKKMRSRTSAPRRAPIPKTAMVTLSLEGRTPGGNLGKVWEKVKYDLWGRNATKHYSRLQLEQKCVKHGGKAGMSSEFLFRYNTVRVVSE